MIDRKRLEIFDHKAKSIIRETGGLLHEMLHERNFILRGYQLAGLSEVEALARIELLENRYFDK